MGDIASGDASAPSHPAITAEIQRAEDRLDHLATVAAENYRPPSAQAQEVVATHEKLRAALVAAASDLEGACAARGLTVQRQPGRGTLPPEEWLRQTRRLTAQARAKRPSLLASRRLQELKRLHDDAAGLLSSLDAMIVDLDARTVSTVESLYGPAFAEVARVVAEAASTMFDHAEPPVLTGLHLPTWVDAKGGAATGGPRVSPGTITLTTVKLGLRATVPSPSTKEMTQAIVAAGGPSAPAFPVQLDLDQCGGFVTNSREAVEVATIDLLSQLPGGRVRVDAIDPLAMGDSARFLFDLNDAGDKILADAVWTTPGQVEKLLTSLEEHITFVTQKYLQGRKTLTEYNSAAGEIAEPYRLLLMYDYPAVFSRDRNFWDEESLARLQRIAAVGRRAGVFILVHLGERRGQAEYLDDLTWLTQDKLAVPTTSTDRGLLERLKLDWKFEPHRCPSDKEREQLFAGLLRDLQQAQTAQIDPGRLSALAEARMASDLARGLAVEPVVDDEDPDTWWRSSAIDRIQVPFGRMGASEVARLDFNSDLESSALVGGRTGSGKSFLLHALIMGMVTSYSPDELALYLVDLKEGVEFKQYADERLPHARAIAIESNREFAISLLEAIDKEIAARGALFKSKLGGAAVSLPQFRKETGEQWPRVLVVIDEFHKMFEPDDAMARRALGLLERVIKEGRAFGVHTVLASQSLSNVDVGFKNLAGQIPYRVVLSSSDHDSRLMLGEDNADARLLTRPGEGILNAKGGAREANKRFQTVYWAPERRAVVLQRLRQRAPDANRPHVFEGNAAVTASDFGAELFLGDGQGVALPVGAPMSLEPPVVAKFERAPGSNLLVVDVEGLEALATLCTSLVAQRHPTSFVDFASVEHEWEDTFEQLAGRGLRRVNRRRFPELLQEALDETTRRHDARDYNLPSQVLVLAGLHRARELDPDDYDDESLHNQLKTLLKDGPEVGIHVIGWSDRRAGLDRRLDSQSVREFGLRILGRMSEEDSRALCDQELAARISPAQVVLDDFDRARTQVLRRFRYPGSAWVLSVTSAGARRDG